MNKPYSSKCVPFEYWPALHDKEDELIQHPIITYKITQEKSKKKRHEATSSSIAITSETNIYELFQRIALGTGTCSMSCLHRKHLCARYSPTTIPRKY